MLSKQAYQAVVINGSTDVPRRAQRRHVISSQQRIHHSFLYGLDGSEVNRVTLFVVDPVE